ncbi:MAG TPA: bacillithiol biosynthesis cysteine-adding enzyme BshC [Pyrinomonadaceae bacterium]|nr:bacillithiol biosynthesis cysteine-adding enzyme BshC [Pyrinomonadaceae bacterium]
MSTTEIACHSTPEQAGLRVETIKFDQIPQQTRLFLDYLRDPVALRRFYPEAVRAHYEVSERRERVLANHKTDRTAVCDALDRMNRGWGATEKTLANIRQLREADCIAVVSGQQAGLFAGPLYTIYKALSAVKLAECMAQRGIKSVPVFWIATEDHDFPEVAKAEIINRDCALSNVSVPAEVHPDGLPVGRVPLDESIETSVQSLLAALPKTEFSEDLEKLLRTAYQPGRKFGDAFAQVMTALIGQKGLILLDPLDSQLKQAAAPLYAEAARRAHEIAIAIVDRSRELEAAGYHAQVAPSENSFPLFWHDDNGARHALIRNENSKYQAKSANQKPDRQGGLDGNQEYSAEDLAEWAQREPDRFSPNVTLRAVVQDFLLPTVAYYGGAAEIAYFAQTAEVYRILDRPATPILPRASMTLVERHTWRSLERYGIRLVDFFGGVDHVLARVVKEYLGKETSEAFDHTTQSFNNELDDLQEQLRRVDPTLAEALEKGRRKINYQIDGLRTRFNRAQVGRDEAVQRQIERAFDLLYPGKTLQERRINITSLLARHGRYVVDWIYGAIDLGSNDHEVVFL